MAYTLEQLSADIRKTLKADSGVTGKQQVCKTTRNSSPGT